MPVEDPFSQIRSHFILFIRLCSSKTESHLADNISCILLHVVCVPSYKVGENINQILFISLKKFSVKILCHSYSTKLHYGHNLWPVLNFDDSYLLGLHWDQVSKKHQICKSCMQVARFQIGAIGISYKTPFCRTNQSHLSNACYNRSNFFSLQIILLNFISIKCQIEIASMNATHTCTKTVLVLKTFFKCSFPKLVLLKQTGCNTFKTRPIVLWSISQHRFY